jgi:hypothetical protein
MTARRPGEPIANLYTDSVGACFRLWTLPLRPGVDIYSLAPRSFVG